ncbi:restriction endonuclease subunit S [Pseudomonas chlororaphis]
MKFECLTTIGEISDVYDGPHATPKKRDVGPVFLGISSLNKGAIDLSQSEHLSEEDFAEWTRRVTPEEGDVVFSYETRIGEAAIIPSGLRCCLGRRMGLLRPKRDKIIPEFLLYSYLGPEFQAVIKARTIHGSTVDRLALKDLPNFPIRTRPLHEQNEIVEVLSSLDKKISLNHQISQTLEQMAQAIFNSWFVDFDPVRAKMDGREPENMDAATAALFPNDLVGSEFGLIPRGWEMTTLRQLTSKIGSGATPKGGREVYLNEGVALIRSQNVYDSLFMWDGLAHISDDASVQLKGVEVFPEDILLNITGASILRTCVVVQEVLPARVNQHVAIIRAKPGVSARYLHLHLLRRKVKNYLLGLNAGGSREAVTKSHIESVPILNPGRNLLLRFQEMLEPLFSEVECLAGQSRMLSDLRNALLPKLLSGDLKVRET